MIETIRTKRFTIDRTAYLRTMWAYRIWRRVAGLVLVILVFAGTMTALGQPSVAVGALYGSGVLPLALVGRYFTTRRMIYGKEAAQAFDDARTIEFSEAGLHTITEGGIESTLPWSHVQRAESRGPFILLSVATNRMAVPDAAFASVADREVVWALLRDKGLVKR